MAKLLERNTAGVLVPAYDEDRIIDQLKVFFYDHQHFAWNDQGGENCMTWCGSWIRDRIGADPAESFRGRLNSEEEADVLIAKNGGMVAFADAMLHPLRIRRTTEPRTGDVGVVEAVVDYSGRVKQVAAICYGPTWAFITPGRVVSKKSNVAAAWRINDAP